MQGFLQSTAHRQDTVLSKGTHLDDAKTESDWWKAEGLQQEARRNTNVLLADLKACSITRNLERGKQVHAEAVTCGHIRSIYVTTALINMYAKCGSMGNAHRMFDSMMRQNVVSWTALILGYANNGQGHTALELFTRMGIEGISPNSVTFLAAVKACTSLALEGACRWECRHRGKELYNVSVENGCDSDVYLQSTLVDMYAKCGSMNDAREMFDSMTNPNVVSWNALLMGYVDNGQGLTALGLFTRMRKAGFADPDYVTFVAALKSCCSCKDEGASEFIVKEIHNLAVENGGNSDVLQNTLVDMYAKCGCLIEARSVFDNMKHPDLVSWTAMILGYADNGQGFTALDLFSRMRTEGPAPNSVTFVAALKACTSIAVIDGRWTECRDRGNEIHRFAVENGCHSDVYVQSTLVDMYAKCGCMGEAQDVFAIIKRPDVVSWTALILGYAVNGKSFVALDLFKNMRTKGPVPNTVTYAAALKACSLAGALEVGRTIHSEMECESDLDVGLVTCLVDFYAKCGSLAEAQSVFDMYADRRNSVTWNALLAGYSSCGNNEAVFGLFAGMQGAGFRPDGVTFSCILSCCSHAGLVEKGKECFDTMSTKHGIMPTVEHYNCMVDTLGRANKLEDAMALLERMHCSPNDVTWTTILGACRKWKNVETWKLAFRHLINFSDLDLADYMLVGQISGARTETVITQSS